MTESFAELFEQSLITAPMRPGGLIIGEVVRVDSEVVVVHE